MKNKLLIYKLLIVVVMVMVWVFIYPKLPDTVPIHWWFDGQADRMWSKLMHVVMFPAIALFMALLFSYLPKLDPKKENYEKFGSVWEIFQFSILGFFLYIYIVSSYIMFNPEYNISKFVLFGIWLLFVILWNYMWKIRQNYFVGIKLPWTLADEEVWNKTHRFGGKMFMLGWALFILNTFFLRQIVWVFTVVVCLIIFSPIIYAYLIFKKKKSLK